jgi:type IV pilus assembly protein PilC
MAEFAYRVVAPDGREKKGTMEGKTAEQVSNMLKSQGNSVISVSEAGVLSRGINLSFGKKVNARDFSIFCHQTVSILGAGVSIIEALGMMKDSTENPTLKGALAGVHEDIAKGEALTIAMRKRRNVFPEMLCNMVEAGEASGSLDVAFKRMATQFEKDDKLKKTIKKATIYPMVLVVLMIGMMFLMLLWVIPTFMGMFEDLDTEMPAITLAIISLSEFVQSYWWIILLVIVGTVFGFREFAKTPAGKKTLGGLVLKMPVIGPLQTKNACARL